MSFRRYLEEVARDPDRAGKLVDNLYNRDQRRKGWMGRLNDKMKFAGKLKPVRNFMGTKQTPTEDDSHYRAARKAGGAKRRVYVLMDKSRRLKSHTELNKDKINHYHRTYDPTDKGASHVPYVTLHRDGTHTVNDGHHHVASARARGHKGFWADADED